jgi:hypothetical protein
MMMELTKKQIQNAEQAWHDEAMAMTPGVFTLSPEQIIKAIAPHIQYAAHPAAQAFSVTLDEAHNIRQGFLGETGDLAMQRVVNAILARRPAAASRPHIVCLCGSTRFYDAFQQANYDETMNGHIVLSVGFYPHSKAKAGHGEGVGHDSAEKIALDELHKRKIDLCDEVFVLNAGGYIGKSTEAEISYAKAHSKPVRYLETRPAAQEAPTVKPDSSCEYCGPVCYGRAEHNARVENGDKWRPAQEAPTRTKEDFINGVFGYKRVIDTAAAPEASEWPERVCTGCGKSVSYDNGNVTFSCSCSDKGWKFKYDATPAPSAQEGELVEKWPSSTCAECGKVMESGRIRKCERGGECSWYIPYAIHAYIKRLAVARPQIEALERIIDTKDRTIDQLIAIRPEIVSKARVGYVRLDDVEKAIIDAMNADDVASLYDEPMEFIEFVRARLTPPQGPILEERLRRIVSAEGVNVDNKVAEIMHEIGEKK